jgi:16S rRNA G527 N7-methylase RsmG
VLLVGGPDVVARALVEVVWPVAVLSELVALLVDVGSGAGPPVDVVEVVEIPVPLEESVGPDVAVVD